MPLPHEIEEGRRFDHFASDYDASDGQYPLRTVIRNRAVSVVGDLHPRVVLDGGCGTGRALIELSPDIDRGIGVDISSKMVEVARVNASRRGTTNLRFIYGSLLDLADGLTAKEELEAPDLIMSTYSMHHLSRQEKQRVVAAFASVLTATCSIVIGDLMFFESPADYVSDYEKIGYDPATDTPETVDTMTVMLEDCGFAVTPIQVHPLAGIIVARRPARRGT